MVGAFGLVYCIVNNTLDLDTLPGIAMQLSNTFGLVVVLILLAFGLVHVPRSLWKRSNPEEDLRHQQYRCASMDAWVSIEQPRFNQDTCL